MCGGVLRGATIMYGREASVGALLEEVDKDRLLYETSGGGVTLSGGEPTMQPRFASALMGALKKRGYHTALDTCGHAEWGGSWRGSSRMQTSCSTTSSTWTHLPIGR